ncbi:hypothetical protein LF41_2332 [Lysobacter dokdonensis DS-58]|uniref:Uncharacterized protein n=1 Tax=Lysobacter dokdonensis DS-58 TaxID=1300345 RepID=A0A0A2X3K8_9GAMM|nr:hypothetical protein LF41_2332 [Lysobacter dokdonensis DS-58]
MANAPLMPSRSEERTPAAAPAKTTNAPERFDQRRPSISI